MPIDIKNLNPPARFFYNKDEWVELRTLPMSEIRKIRKSTVTKQVEYHQVKNQEKPFRYENEIIDEDKLDEMLWDYQIVDWNLVDQDNKKIPCNTDNKLLLMGNCTEFSEFVLESLRQMHKDEKKQKKDSEKN